MIVEQWDIVRARINPRDKDEHPAVILSPPEVCADGLEFLTAANCLFIHGIPKRIITAKTGRVSFERRRAICRKIREVWRWLN